MKYTKGVDFRLQFHRLLDMKIKFSCAYCKSSFFEYRCVRRHKKAFCSRRCMARYRAKFWRGEDSPKYRPEIHRIVKCGFCGNPLKHRLKRIERVKNNFCNKICRGKWLSLHNVRENNPAWRGGSSYWRGSNWRLIRNRIILKRRNRCEICKMTKRKMEVHHIVPVKNLLTNISIWNHPKNLILLCSACHQILEGISRRFVFMLKANHEVT